MFSATKFLQNFVKNRPEIGQFTRINFLYNIRCVKNSSPESSQVSEYLLKLIAVSIDPPVAKLIVN